MAVFLRRFACAKPLLSCSQQRPLAAAHQSSFTGVHWHCNSGKWLASVRDPASKRKRYLGAFGKEQQAARVRDAAAVILLGLGSQLNFPDCMPSQQDLHDAQLRLMPKRKSSTYKGVCHVRGRWTASIRIKGERRFLGTFGSELEAAEMVDSSLRSNSVPRSRQLLLLNFVQPEDFFFEDTWQYEPVPQGKTSRFLGVYFHSVQKKFCAQFQGKHIGVFGSELEAARAFDVASALKGWRTNFAPPGHRVSMAESVIDFEHCVLIFPTGEALFQSYCRYMPLCVPEQLRRPGQRRLSQRRPPQCRDLSCQRSCNRVRLQSHRKQTFAYHGCIMGSF